LQPARLLVSYALGLLLLSCNAFKDTRDAYLLAAFWPGSPPFLAPPSLLAWTLPGAEFWLSSVKDMAV
jgi:hypothetical protein